MSLKRSVLKVGGTAVLALLIGLSSIITAEPDMAFAKSKKKKERDKTPLPDVEMCFYRKHDAPYLIWISAGNKKLDNTEKFRLPQRDSNGKAYCVSVE